MIKILEDFSTPKLSKAIEANLLGIITYLGQLPHTEWYDEPDITWFSTGIPHPRLNGVIRSEFGPDDIDNKIDRTLSYFRSRKVPMSWLTGLTTQPPYVEKHLETHGLTGNAGFPGMAVDLLTVIEDPPLPSDLKIERVKDIETMQEWLYPYATSFEYPDYVTRAFFQSYTDAGFEPHLPLQHYIGRQDGVTVACSSLLLNSGVAGIYNVGTLPHLRRQGIGTAMTLAPLREAREIGYHIGILLSSPSGYNVYRRIGFEKCCELRAYVWGWQ